MPRPRLFLTLLLALTAAALSVHAQDDPVPTFVSTRFASLEEGETFREILLIGGFDFIGIDAADLLDTLTAEIDQPRGTIDAVGALHDTLTHPAAQDALVDMTALLTALEQSRDFAPAFVNYANVDGRQQYIPWMQATFIMAARFDAIQYLPPDARLNRLTWEDLAAWCQNIHTETGEPRCGFAQAGLFHRVLQGYLYPGFTGGVVSRFRGNSAAAMLTYLRDDLYPHVHPDAVRYTAMDDPLLDGDVWVTLDHTARLRRAFEVAPDDFIAFPTPIGAHGRHFMPVQVGLAIPRNAPTPATGQAVIEFLTRPNTQRRVLEQLGFYPVVLGVDSTVLPPGLESLRRAVEAEVTDEAATMVAYPVGLGERAGEINVIYRRAFERAVYNEEPLEVVLEEEGDALQALFEQTDAPCWQPDTIRNRYCIVGGHAEPRSGEGAVEPAND